MARFEKEIATPKTDRTAILQLIRTLKKAGWKAVSITYPEDVNVRGLSSNAIATLITDNYDIAILEFKKPEAERYPTQWIYFVLGNSPEEAAADYTANNEEFNNIIAETTEGW